MTYCTMSQFSFPTRKNYVITLWKFPIWIFLLGMMNSKMGKISTGTEGWGTNVVHFLLTYQIWWFKITKRVCSVWSVANSLLGLHVKIMQIKFSYFEAIFDPIHYSGYYLTLHCTVYTVEMYEVYVMMYKVS